MLQNDQLLLELEKLVEDNRVAFERAKQLLASVKAVSNSNSEAPTFAVSASTPDGPSPESPVTIPPNSRLQSAAPWLDLQTLAEVEVTSEGSAAYPIASSLSHESGPGWRSHEPGNQTIRLVFAIPQSIHRIQLVFQEEKLERTQEFVLRWRQRGAQEYREVLRQQYVFSPAGSTREVENYQVQLTDLVAAELSITPDLKGGNACACLAKWSMA